MSVITKLDIALAKEGDAKALETLIRSMQNKVYQLAVRMLADPGAAEDATQEILIRIVTKLSTFREESQFETWAYRVATNYLLTTRKVIANDPGLSFQMFSADLLEGLVDEQSAAPDDHIMLNELRLRCTMAMLLCLDRDHRAAYVLGEIMEFEHGEAAQVLAISSANFRKRLSRARTKVQEFTASTCGLANASAPCSCQRRLPAAIAMQRIPKAPSHAFNDTPGFDEVKCVASQTQDDLIAVKLQRSVGSVITRKNFAAEVLHLVDPPD